MSRWFSRRAVLVGGTSAPAAAALSACQSPGASEPSARQGRLSFRPSAPPAGSGRRRGRFDLQGVQGAQLAELSVPTESDGQSLRLVVMLHGAGGVARSALDILREEADSHRLLLVAPTSTAASWDVLAGGYGPDVRNIDRLLREVAARYRVRGYIVGGFSDGASYALSLGLANGDIFDSVIAFSPGFETAELANGWPRFLLSHGTGDRTLPIDRCSRRIVPSLEDAGYDVTYHEFSGGHAVPQTIQRRAVAWLDG